METHRGDKGLAVAAPLVKVVYIAGMGRSGTTLLGSLLGQLDGFFFGGEFRHLGARIAQHGSCGCGEDVAACPPWQAILSSAFPGTDGAPDPSPLQIETSDAGVRGMVGQRLAARGLLPDPPRLVRSRAAFGAVLRAIPEVTGSRRRRLLQVARFGALLEAAGRVESTVVHLVRDPRAVAHSRQRRIERRGVALKPGPTGFALVYDSSNTVVELAWGRDRYIRLRYEDLVRSPAATVEQIAALVGEPATGLRMISTDTVDLEPTHCVAGNGNRFQSGEVRIELDDEWARAGLLTAGQSTVVTALTWPLRARHRYRGAGGARS